MTNVWLNGELVDASAATVHVTDHGVTVGDGVFETTRTEDGVPVALTRHLARLRRGVAGLGLECHWTDDELRDAMQAVADSVLADAPTGSEARVRLTATGGLGPLGSGRDAGPMSVFIAGSVLGPRSPTGIAITVPWRRNEHSAIAGLKTTSYAENVVALAAATAAGAAEAILANTAGNLCEGTGSNVFLVLDGRIVTPPLSSGCLAGVTRAIVCDLVDVHEEDVAFDAIHRADEVFLTSSIRDVQGQSRIDDVTFDAPGPVTSAVAQAFSARLAETVDP